MPKGELEKASATLSLANQLAEKYDGKVKSLFTHAFEGFAVSLPRKSIAYEICGMAAVASVEENQAYYQADRLEAPASPFTWPRAMLLVWLINIVL